MRERLARQRQQFGKFSRVMGSGRSWCRSPGSGSGGLCSGMDLCTLGCGSTWQAVPAMDAGTGQEGQLFFRRYEPDQVRRVRKLA
jgi:hypothetical protein